MPSVLSNALRYDVFCTVVFGPMDVVVAGVFVAAAGVASS
jgi:hypothetical protein